jgi:hypothetical protein
MTKPHDVVIRGVAKITVPIGFAIVGWMLKAVVMSDFGPMVLALLAFTLLLTYSALAGYTGRLWIEKHRSRCPRVVLEPQENSLGQVDSRYRDRCDQYCDPQVYATFAGIFWPGALPAMMGASLVAKPSSHVNVAIEIARMEAELGMSEKADRTEQ